MWPAILIFSAFWIADWRRKDYSWEHTLATLAFCLLILVPLAAFTPGWLWKTVLMAYLTFPWWFIPLYMRGRPATNAAPRMRPFDPEHDDVWPELPRLVDQAARALEAQGLVRIGTFREDAPGDLATLTAHLESPDGTDAVTVNGATSLLMPGTEAERRTCEVNTVVGMVFADGRRLAVGNTYLMPRGAPGGTTERFTTVDDPARLLRIARAYRARWFADARPVPVRGDTPPLEFWVDRHRRMMEADAARGYYRRRPDGAWGVTLWGGLVIGWGMMFPFRHVGELRRRLRERRILRELGMEAAGAPSFPRPRTMHPHDLQGATAVALAILFLLQR